MKPSNSRSITLWFAVVLGVSGCATAPTATNEHSRAVEIKIPNSAKIDDKFDVVWDRLVKRLSSDFFVINNIDKNSRLINLSFSSQKPSQYVDCGKSLRTFTNAQGERRFEYLSADSSAFLTVDQTNRLPIEVRRTSRLEGRANIYVAPEGDATSVAVNTRYVVSLVVAMRRLDGQTTSDNITWDFSTKQHFSGAEVACTANGEIERKILMMANP